MRAPTSHRKTIKGDAAISLKGPSIESVSPMLLDERTVSVSDEANYLAEIKYDGYRVLAEFGNKRCTLRSRNGADCSKWFPEVTSALMMLDCDRMIVDGEMCVLDDLGRSHFDLLHERARHRRLRKGDAPVTYCAFDLLVFEDCDVMHFPLVRRKSMLQSLLAATIDHVMYVTHVSADDIAQPVTWLYNHSLSLKLEGVVAKRSDSAYKPGERSADWIKIKRPGAVPPSRFRRSGPRPA